MCTPVVIGTKHLSASLNETLKIAVYVYYVRKLMIMKYKSTSFYSAPWIIISFNSGAESFCRSLKRTNNCEYFSSAIKTSFLVFIKDENTLIQIRC